MVSSASDNLVREVENRIRLVVASGMPRWMECGGRHLTGSLQAARSRNRRPRLWKLRMGKREITEDNNSIQEVGTGSGKLEVVNIQKADQDGSEMMEDLNEWS